MQLTCSSSPETLEYVCDSWNMTDTECGDKDQLSFAITTFPYHRVQEKNCAYFLLKNASAYNENVIKYLINTKQAVN